MQGRPEPKYIHIMQRHIHQKLDTAPGHGSLQRNMRMVLRISKSINNTDLHVTLAHIHAKTHTHKYALACA